MWTDAAPAVGQFVLTAVAVLGFLGAVLVILPPSLSFLGLTRVRYTISDDPAAVADVPGDEVYQRLLGELTHLGYRPAGVVDERMWFQGHEWTFRALLRKFRSLDGRTFASLYRLRDTGPWRVAFETVCEGGVLVQTAAPGVGLLQLTERVIRTEVGQLDVAATRDQHVRLLGQIEAAGGPKAVRMNLGEYAAVGERIDEQNVRSPGDASGFLVPLVSLMFPAALMAGVRYGVVTLLGWPPASVEVETGLALAGGCLAHVAATLLIFPRIVAQSEACIATEQAEAAPVDLAAVLADHFRPAVTAPPRR